ncbi:hypothetical protein CIL03_18580 [Virgibacillus indicus]|uniref:DUF2512 domain-containing protein n=1 Tax=Virgibacillus indicus TaxID=2024554 RepID=A0A265N6K1_9BACI|nr:YndM family protein [Virgibacillus indicus]OZU87104.1 hypothetical protein CIL03_18580 [Virgibacillus indicus]
MRYIIAFFIKFLMISAVLWIALNWFFDTTFIEMLTISFILTAVSYLGDVFILPHLENFVASVIDFIIAWAGIWILGALLLEQPIPLESISLVSAAVIGIGEFFFHRYMFDRVLDDEIADVENEAKLIQNRDFQTEFGTETEMESSTRRSRDKNNKKQK